VQPVHLECQPGVGFALQPVGNQEHDGALPEHRRPQSLLKVCSEIAIRVPPAQSSTADEQLASASSGSRARKARVNIGQAGAKQKDRHALACIGNGVQEMQKQPVYSLIEPIYRAAPRSGPACRSVRAMDIDDVAAGAQGARQRAAHIEPQAARIRLVAAGAQLGLRRPGFHLRRSAAEEISRR